MTPTREEVETVFSELMDEYERTTIGIFQWTCCQQTKSKG